MQGLNATVNGWDGKGKKLRGTSNAVWIPNGQDGRGKTHWLVFSSSCVEHALQSGCKMVVMVEGNTTSLSTGCVEHTLQFGLKRLGRRRATHWFFYKPAAQNHQSQINFRNLTAQIRVNTCWILQFPQIECQIGFLSQLRRTSHASLVAKWVFSASCVEPAMLVRMPNGFSSVHCLQIRGNTCKLLYCSHKKCLIFCPPAAQSQQCNFSAILAVPAD